MRKKVFGRQLGRARKARRALFGSLITALIINDKIVTTRAKAKAVVGQVDKLVTKLKSGEIAKTRQVLAYLGNKRDILKIFISRTKTQLGGRESGFTRIILLPRRRGDNAGMVRIEWVEKITEKQSKSTTKKEEKKEAKSGLKGKS